MEYSNWNKKSISMEKWIQILEEHSQSYKNYCDAEEERIAVILDEDEIIRKWNNFLRFVMK